MKEVNPYAASEQPRERGMPMYATQVRYKVLALSVAMAVLLYLDRFALNAVQPLIMEELGITLTQMGWVTGMFFWMYALAQVPAGWLGDRWGGRATLTLFVAGWSIAFGLQALAMTLWMLLVMRSLQGVAQAGAYAVTAGFLKNWIEPERRGFANSAVSMGGRAGGVLTNIATPLLVSAVAPLTLLLLGTESGSWRVVFLLYAVLGIGWAGSFWRFFRDTPEEHEDVSEAELLVIRGATASEEAAATKVISPLGPAPPVYVILGNPNLWLLSAAMFCVNIGWIFLATSQITYMKATFESSLVMAGSYTAMTAFCGMVGCICGGLATDFFVRTLGLVWGRRLPGMVACGGAAGMYLIAMQLTSVEAVALAFGSVYFLNDFLLGGLWSTVQDVGGRNSGAMFGFINMSGNLGAAIFPVVIGLLVESQSWSLVFLVSAGAYLVAFTLWFFVDPRIKLPEPAVV